MSPQYHLLIICYFTVVIAKRGGGGGGSFGRGGGSHSYPASHGLSGNTYSGAGYHRSTNTHTYPHSTGLSGNAHSSTSYTRRTEVHNHYHYAPPQHISYGSQQHPVFVGAPPSYVYVYKNSGSRYDNLLTGLALYNLGRMSSSHRHHDRYYERDRMQEYRGIPGEICKLGISKSNGEYEETRIDCRLISSFIWEAEREKPDSTVTKTVNTTKTIFDGNTTVTVQDTTVEAVKIKGSSIQVNPGMKCFMIRISRDTSTLKKNVECGLLQEYASRSLRYDSYTGRSIQVVPGTFLIVAFLMTLLRQI